MLNIEVSICLNYPKNISTVGVHWEDSSQLECACMHIDLKNMFLQIGMVPHVFNPSSWRDDGLQGKLLPHANEFEASLVYMRPGLKQTNKMWVHTNAIDFVVHSSIY